MKIGKLSYNGKTAESLGVFVSGAGTYNAAEEDVTAYEVPGRSGDILISNNRYRNIDVTYPAFIPSDFEERVQAIRNWMRSARSYARIEDNYDLLHFRMGVGKEILSFSPAQQNRAANCQLVFNCKPQRFLYSGEEDFTPGEWGPTETLSGDIVSFENDGNKAFASLTLPLSPVQSFNGYDRPWPGGAGKNKLDINNEAPNSDAHIRRYLTTLPAGTYTVSAECHSTADTDCAVLLGYSDNTYTSTQLLKNNAWSSVTFVAEKDVTKVWVYSSINFASSQNYVLTQLNDLQVELGDAATSYEPYANICPISGWDGANVTVSPTTTGGTVYPVTWSEAGTVYGGEVDIVSGELVVDKAMVDLGTLAWVPYGATSSYDRYVSNGINSTVKGGTIGICSHFRGSRSYAAGNIVIGTGTSKLTVFTTKGLYASASDFKTAMNGATFVYELASPQTYQLTPTQVMTLLGENNVWSDTGPVEAEIGENPNVLANPTLFDALPLITLTNPGRGATVTVGEYTLTCLEAYSGTVTIDCENEDIYSGPQNLNNKWSGSFPVLKPGNNPVSISGATGTIKPRWWEL